MSIYILPIVPRKEWLRSNKLALSIILKLKKNLIIKMLHMFFIMKLGDSNPLAFYWLEISDGSK
jgi:hypothetical protein